LKHQPNVPTRNRKPLRDDAEDRWEVRIGDFRVFYRVLFDGQTVVLTAIGRKAHNRLLIDGEEVEP
ncbi:MAG TPA: type II toxin-antitoxin system RelE/ParE family toxin, partial [Planctomycetaceae bacterium]|nr:type II toxin-antitoxin system RelE/ParE family toxin [Planctomycetaceae bacterium]